MAGRKEYYDNAVDRSDSKVDALKRINALLKHKRSQSEVEMAKNAIVAKFGEGAADSLGVAVPDYNITVEFARRMGMSVSDLMTRLGKSVKPKPSEPTPDVKGEPEAPEVPELPEVPDVSGAAAGDSPTPDVKGEPEKKRGPVGAATSTIGSGGTAGKKK